MLADNIAEIVRLDRLIEEIAAKPVVSPADIAEYKRLKDLRRPQVRAIQNAK